MFDLSVSAEMVFADRPFAERVQAIADAGFRVEFGDWRDRPMEIFRERPDIRVGPIIAATAGTILHPDGVEALIDTVAESISVARSIGSPNLILLAGVLDADGQVDHRVHPDEITRWITAYKALTRLAEVAEANDVMLCLEHLNNVVDHPGYGVHRVDQAAQLVREVGSPHLKVLLDLYHAQVEQGNLIDLIRSHVEVVGHVHVADVPGRHEPGTGEIEYHRVAAALAEAGYRGTVGLEAFPSADPGAAMEAFRKVFGA